MVDDGVATGATMKVAIRAVRAAGAAKVVVAVPVAAPSSVRELETEADEVVCLDAPESFYAIVVESCATSIISAAAAAAVAVFVSALTQ